LTRPFPADGSRNGRSARGIAVWLIVGLAPAGVFMGAAPGADAAITGVFANTPTPIPCTVQGNGVRLCDETTFSPAQPRSTVKTFDGVPIDVRVAIPPEPTSGPDGPYPLVMLFHGYGGSKFSLARMESWLGRGYATFSMTARGFGESCGTSAARSADPSGCANGYVRFMDSRYEVRDAQELAGLLADEGHTSFTQIGAFGSSYGGSLSMALAALKDRKMLPDGSLGPWTSPSGRSMRIAAATPESPWTDLMYSLVPNGRTLDYVSDAPYVGRTGVLKQSWENALYDSGLAGFYAPAGSDPDAYLTGWHNALNAGEPYDDPNGDPLPFGADLRDELTAHHSSYYLDHSQAPAPLLISNGLTDDLFPADEAIRFYNRMRTQHPNAAVSLFLGSFGHQRAQNKSSDMAQQSAAQRAWMDFYVKGTGSVPFRGVQALTQACPSATPSEGPFSAGDWAHLAPGEVRFDSAGRKTILPTAGDQTIANAFDPFVSGPGVACVTAPASDQPGTATYRMDPVLPGQGFTLMGSPTVIADITSPGSNSQIAARLLDVDPTIGRETLVARGLWRPAFSSTPVRQVFQLHPNGYRFAPGRTVKLELLPKDSPYGRTSNGQGNVTVENLHLRLPVLEAPGPLNGLVQAPLPKFVPPGYQLAVDFVPPGYPRPRAASLLLASLVVAYRECTLPTGVHSLSLAGGSCGPPAQASGELTVGTRDANGEEVRSVGSVRFDLVPGAQGTPADDTDIAAAFSMTDVRQSDLSDYTGELQVRSSARITDRANGDGAPEPATVQDMPLPVTAPCAATASAQEGATCSVSTSFDAIAPGSVPEGQRSIWQLGQVEVLDGGPDGLASTTPNGVFARQGLFAP
jgi:predicted acyl esterase